MKAKLSLKCYLSLSFLAMALLLVAGYAGLSLNFYSRGLDSVTAANLAHAVRMYVDFQRRGLEMGPFPPPPPPPPPPHLHPDQALQIVTDWKDMPSRVRSRIKEPLKEGELYKFEISKWPNPPLELNFVMLLRIDGKKYYVRQAFTPETASPLMGRQIAETMRTLFIVSASTVVALCLMVWLLFRRIARPARALEGWAASLDELALKSQPPDFCYPELNRLAELIRNSLIAEHLTLERERLFLQYSSHELRTPISVVLAATELLGKIQQGREGEGHTAENAIVQRIDRAGHTMAHLVETLLWLGKDVAELPPSTVVDLEILLREIIHDADYLRAGKHLDLAVQTEPCVMRIPETAARIVLGNIVRNAFQHTLRGTIYVNQCGAAVEVINFISKESDLATDIGFGLGLELTSRLSERLGWKYEHKSFPGRNVVLLCLREPQLFTDAEEPSPERVPQTS